MTCASLVVLLVSASLSAAHPSGAGLYGTGYPEHDDWFHPADQNPESAELCTSLRRHMDVLLRSKTFRCERLPGDTPDDVEKFCTSSGLPTISKCMAENEENGDAAQCLLNAQEDIAAVQSTPLSWCFCQSLFESFLSVFSTSQLLCTENLLNDGNRDPRLFIIDNTLYNQIHDHLGPKGLPIYPKDGDNDADRDAKFVIFSPDLTKTIKDHLAPKKENIPFYPKPSATYTKSVVTTKSSTTASGGVATA